MIKVISFNANGIRPAARKGFFEWFEKTNADFLVSVKIISIQATFL